jgi:hypothetical protein
MGSSDLMFSDLMVLLLTDKDAFAYFLSTVSLMKYYCISSLSHLQRLTTSKLLTKPH